MVAVRSRMVPVGANEIASYVTSVRIEGIELEIDIQTVSYYTRIQATPVIQYLNSSDLYVLITSQPLA
jgi:hypothetical protein